MIQEDLKTFLEVKSGVNVYPSILPSTAELSSIVYKQTGFNRNNDSALNSSDVRDYRFTIFVITKSARDMHTISENLIEELEGFSGLMGETNVLITRIKNAVDLFNYSQNTHEKTINIEIKIRKI